MSALMQKKILFCFAFVFVALYLAVLHEPPLQRMTLGQKETVFAASRQTAEAEQPCGDSPKEDSPELLRLLHDKDLASEHTDEFTWRVLAEITRPATPRQVPLPGGGSVVSNDEIWETWSDDSSLFPRQADSSHKPCWNKSRQRDGIPLAKGTSMSASSSAIIKVTSPASTGDANADGSSTPVTPVDPCEAVVGHCVEVRHNRQDFESIVSNGLWNVQGQLKAVQAGTKDFVPNGQTIDPESIEIKAAWRPILCKDRADCDGQKAKYHWNYDSRGILYGLIAMHVITKTLPKWTWATFEWKDNKGRCDYYGCHDSFGNEEIDVAQKDKTASKHHRINKSSKVLRLNWRGASKTEWQNYILKGTQTDFNTKKGEATILGNSVLEAKVKGGTASCITCHAEASINKFGRSPTLMDLLPLSRQAHAQQPDGPRAGPIGVPQLPEGLSPIGFIWSAKNASCLRGNCPPITMPEN